MDFNSNYNLVKKYIIEVFPVDEDRFKVINQMLVNTELSPANSINSFSWNEIDIPYEITPTINVGNQNVRVGNVLVELTNPVECSEVIKFVGESIIYFIKSVHQKQGRPSYIIKGYIFAIFAAMFLPNGLGKKTRKKSCRCFWY